MYFAPSILIAKKAMWLVPAQFLPACYESSFKASFSLYILIPSSLTLNPFVLLCTLGTPFKVEVEVCPSLAL
jgi:hypothetical protein